MHYVGNRVYLGRTQRYYHINNITALTVTTRTTVIIIYRLLSSYFRSYDGDTSTIGQSGWKLHEAQTQSLLLQHCVVIPVSVVIARCYTVRPTVPIRLAQCRMDRRYGV